MLGVHLQWPVDDVVLVSGSAIVTWMTTLLTMLAITPSCELARRLAVCIVGWPSGFASELIPARQRRYA